jgi:hypothetical protein
MITPLLNPHNQWLVQNCINDKNQTILLDENAQVISQIDRDGYNVTLLNRDKIAFLSYRGIEIYHR